MSSSEMEVARKHLLTKAERGDKQAQMWLGASFEQGRFGKIDFQEALKWFRKAAAQGDPDAQFCLGQMYEDGEGGRTDTGRHNSFVTNSCPNLASRIIGSSLLPQFSGVLREAGGECYF